MKKLCPQFLISSWQHAWQWCTEKAGVKALPPSPVPLSLSYKDMKKYHLENSNKTLLLIPLRGGEGAVKRLRVNSNSPGLRKFMKFYTLDENPLKFKK